MIAYRPDVDGLRAIAVSSVVLYHGAAWLMPGGFIGVDIFFVISGYLITRLIVKDIEQERFSVAAFYVRRTKRILPALFVVLFTTLALGLFLLTPTELKSLGKTTASTAAFISNFVFWQDTGYFDTAAEAKPLLHTWSLAVEEQFYVLWPLTLLLLHGRRRSGAILGAVIAASFVVCAYLTVRQQSMAFFLLPTRAWELLAGAALALRMVPTIERQSARNLCAVAGLALIAIGLFALDRFSPFPGWYALLPTLGTVLLIASGERGENVVARHLLARKPMVFVGLISYSLYLWHWPLLSLARITQRGHLTDAQTWGIVSLSVALSVLTWRFVETPLRARAVTPAAAPVLRRYAFVSVAALAAGGAVYYSNGLIALAGPEVLRTERARFDINPLSQSCLRWQGDTGPLPSTECQIGQDEYDRRLVIWGDSHADALAPGLVRAAAERAYSSYQLTMAGCPPLVGIQVEGPGADYSACTTFNERVLAYIADDQSVAVVALVARWTLYTENTRFGDDPGPITFLVDREDRSRSPQASKRVFVRALDATIASLRAAGKAVIVLGTTPPMGFSIPECVARNYMPLSGVETCDADAARVLPHLAFADEHIERRAAGRQGICTYLPRRALCPGGLCLGTSGKDILYANDDHLTVRGALFLARHFDFDGCLVAPSDQPARTGSDEGVALFASGPQRAR